MKNYFMNIQDIMCKVIPDCRTSVSNYTLFVNEKEGEVLSYGNLNKMLFDIYISFDSKTLYRNYNDNGVYLIQSEYLLTYFHPKTRKRKFDLLLDFHPDILRNKSIKFENNENLFASDLYKLGNILIKLPYLLDAKFIDLQKVNSQYSYNHRLDCNYIYIEFSIPFEFSNYCMEGI